MGKFTVGQKVVCIAPFEPERFTEWAIVFGIEFPELSGIYTVRSIYETEQGCGIRLEEVLNLPNPCDKKGEGGMVPIDQTFDMEASFDENCFRPLVTQRQEERAVAYG